MSLGRSGSGNGIINGFRGIVGLSCHPTTLSLTTSGLYGSDDFQRPDSPTPGADWVELGDTANGELMGGSIRYTGGGDYSIRDNNFAAGVSQDGPAIIQMNFRQAVDTFDIDLRCLAGSDGYYRVSITKAGFGADTRYRVERSSIVSGVAEILNVVGANSPNPDSLSLRAFVDKPNVRVYHGNIVNLSDVNRDFTLQGQVTDPNPHPDGGLGEGVRIDMSGTTERIDMVFACGYEITVTGLPTGWKARIVREVGGVEVSETEVAVAGVASFDPRTWVLPALRIEMLDDVDTLIDTITPTAPSAAWPGGIWGGDVYQAS